MGPGGWDQLHHIQLGLEMRLRHHEPPAIRPDSFDETGDVACVILAVLHRPLLVAEDEGAQEDLTNCVTREYQPDNSLRSACLGEALYVAFGRDHACKTGIGDIVEKAFGFRPDLDDSTPISTVRD